MEKTFDYTELGKVQVETRELILPISKFKLTKCDGSIRINGIEVKSRNPTAEELCNE